MIHPKGVIFDVGRVLVHWDPAVVWESVAAISQVDASTLRQQKKAVERALGTGQMDGDAFHRYLVERAGTSRVWQDFYTAFCSGLCRNDVALAYARQVQQAGIAVGVTSNTNHIHARWLWEHVPEFDEFNAVVLSSDVGLLKPDPTIYQLTLQRLGRTAQQALFIDDFIENVTAAQALGMAGVVHERWEDSRAAIQAWLSTG
jgi:putative hydrolase of the HAD superfamily